MQPQPPSLLPGLAKGMMMLFGTLMLLTGLVASAYVVYGVWTLFQDPSHSGLLTQIITLVHQFDGSSTSGHPSTLTMGKTGVAFVFGPVLALLMLLALTMALISLVGGILRGLLTEGTHLLKQAGKSGQDA